MLDDGVSTVVGDGLSRKLDDGVETVDDGVCTSEEIGTDETEGIETNEEAKEVEESKGTLDLDKTTGTRKLTR